MKTAKCLGLCLGFVLLSFTVHPTRLLARVMMPLGTVSFGISACVLIGLLIRPTRLLLDAEGFALSGGLIRHPQMVRWAAVERFVLVRLFRHTTCIGYDLVRTSGADNSRRGRGRTADAVIGGVWEYSDDWMVEELNRYRDEAMRKQTDRQIDQTSRFGRRD